MGCRRAKCGTGGPSSQKRACSRANTAVFITSSFPLHPWVPLRLLIHWKGAQRIPVMLQRGFLPPDLSSPEPAEHTGVGVHSGLCMPRAAQKHTTG